MLVRIGGAILYQVTEISRAPDIFASSVCSWKAPALPASGESEKTRGHFIGRAPFSRFAVHEKQKAESET